MRYRNLKKINVSRVPENGEEGEGRVENAREDDGTPERYRTSANNLLIHLFTFFITLLVESTR